MRKILEYVDRKATDYERLPLFEFMQNDAIALRDRLAFVPALAHFVMTFSDLYAHVLRDEPARDRYQELVNAHTYEDGGHWKWFLADLQALDHDPMEPVTQTLRQLWGPETLKTRMLSYHICRLGLGASSLQKLVLVHCIEAVGKVSLKNAAPIGRSLGKQLPKPLVYFGPHHLDTEAEHTLEDDSVRQLLEQASLREDEASRMRALVDETFAAFSEFSADLLSFSLAHQGEQATRGAAASE